MLKTYYHATPLKNMDSIFKLGIQTGRDGFIYLTTEPEDAAKFIAVRSYDDILVVEVMLEEELVRESFDHSQAFFKCRAYYIDENIPSEDILDYYIYSRKAAYSV